MNASDFFQKIKPFKNIFDKDFYIEILEYYSFDKSPQSKQAFMLADLFNLIKKYNDWSFSFLRTEIFSKNYELLFREIEKSLK